VGGSSHFRVLHPLGPVVFRGISFEDASVTSIEILVDPMVESVVSFESCLWESNEGVATVSISSSVNSTEGRSLLDENVTSSLVSIEDAVFRQNAASSSIISNAAAAMSLTRIVFQNNEGNKSIVENGPFTTLETNDVRFEESFVNRGLIFLGFGAELVETEDEKACEVNTTIGEINCTGVLASNDDRDSCLGGNLTECNGTVCTSLDACAADPAEDECFSDWDSVVAAAAEEELDVLTLCPNTGFELNDTAPPILLNRANVTLRCGDLGRRSSNCEISGGSVQIAFEGNATGMRLEGLTMRGSTEVAIDAAGGHESSAEIFDCFFSEHMGDAVVIIANVLEADEGRRLQLDFPAVANSSMAVRIDSSSFEENNVTLGSVVNLGGDVVVADTQFVGNAGEAGAILSVYEGLLKVTGSCFLNNTGNISGSILMLDSSRYESEDDNYGEDNMVESGNCTDVLVNGTCEEFLLEECQVLEISSTPSANPAPSVSPMPTATGAPSYVGGSIVPSSGPSATEVPCIAEWGVLQSMLNATDDTIGGTFTVCKSTTFDLDVLEQGGDLVPLVITGDNILLTCEKGTCAFQGGSTHIRISGSVQNLKIEKFEFRNASEISIYADVQSPFFIEFEDCEWSGNGGNATVWIVNENTTIAEPDPGDDILTDDILDPGSSSDDENSTEAPTMAPSEGGDDELVGGRYLQDEEPRSYLCDRCYFEGNNANEAVILASGVDLSLEAVEFNDNNVDGSVVAAEDSFVYLGSSCLSGNDYNSSQGLIATDDSDQVVLEDNYGSDNTGSDCDGLSSGSDCEPFDSNICIASTKRCFDDWADLSSAIARAGAQSLGGQFALCEDTVISATGLEPIVVNQSETSIICGFGAASTNNCVVLGGETQFEIRGAPVDVVFRGITFLGATNVAVNGAGESESRALFDDCIFLNNNGIAAVLSYDGTLPTSADVTIDDFDPPNNDMSMGLTFEFCRFSDNIVKFGPITILGGTGVVGNSEFVTNSGEAGGIVVYFDGGMVVEESCFIDNSGTLVGSMFASNTSLVNQNDVYGDGNAAGDASNCTDLFVSGACESEDLCSGQCVEFTSDECLKVDSPTGLPTTQPTPNPAIPNPSPILGPPTVRPTTGNFDCFDEWGALSRAVNDTTFPPGNEIVFRLCPNTEFDLSDEDPIIFGEGDVLVQCGINGQLDDNCTIFGGQTHFRIQDNPVRVSFFGLQFRESSLVPVLALASDSASATFEQCLFSNNEGPAAVLVYNEEDGEAYTDQTDLGKLVAPSSPSMEVEFDNCEFTNNQVSFAAVANIAGVATFFRSTFIGNTGAQVGPISASNAATVALSSSCFVDNESEYEGSVFMSVGSDLSLNQNNFGLDNSATAGDECSDIFVETDGNCLDSGSCQGLCSSFTARQCAVPGTDYAYPSVAPTVTPSRAPGGPPSGRFPPVEVEEANFPRSGIFLRGLIIILCVLIAGFVGFVVCRRKYPGARQQNEAMEEDVLIDDDEFEEEIDDDEFEEKPQGSLMVGFGNRKPREDDDGKGKRSGFFGRGKKKKEAEAAPKRDDDEDDDSAAESQENYQGFEASAIDFDNPEYATDTLGNYPS